MDSRRYARSFTFKVASKAEEFDQIHRLNYRTFVEEIPQHPIHPERLRRDPFHDQNTYLIGLAQDRLAGMVAVRDQRPFSLDSKLPNLETYLPPHRRMCEIRLLAIEPTYRGSTLFYELILYLAGYCEQQGYTLALFSATVRQQKLYDHLGGVPFGPLVGTPEALFQPMYLTAETFQETIYALSKEYKAFYQNQI